MSDRRYDDTIDVRVHDLSDRRPPLPEWLGARLLLPDEAVTWVVGPRHAPDWERIATNPALFLAALAVAAALVAGGSLLGGGEALVGAIMAGAAVVLASVFVLGFCSGHFTRLVVTDRRLIIVQGREVCRTWGLNELPLSLLRYRRRPGSLEEAPSIDLDSVKTLLGGASDKFAEAKTILAFGKQLDRIKAREDRPPGAPPGGRPHSSE